VIPVFYRQGDGYERGSEIQKSFQSVSSFLVAKSTKALHPFHSLEAIEDQIKLLKQDASCSLTIFQDVLIHPVQSQKPNFPSRFFAESNKIIFKD